MNSIILKEAENHSILVAKLKKESKYYPNVFLCEEDIEYGKSVYVSTWVRVKRNGVWYKIFCFESYLCSKNESQTSDLFFKFMASVHSIQHLYVVSEKDKIDELQIDEEQRLIQQYNERLR